MESCMLSAWDLPECIIKKYNQMGLYEMFPWQAECLDLPGVLDGRNVVYSAPTSAGKSLVSEIILLKRLKQTGKKAIYILPFVSLAREKMFSMKKIFEVCGLCVDGYIGGVSPAGGFLSVDVAVCTIEKANGLINRLVEDKLIDHLSIIIVDEIHMVGDEQRGYLIELLLTKLRFMSGIDDISCSQSGKLNLQIVGMSATIPNLDLLATWLDATSYQTDKRPVPLKNHLKIGSDIYDKEFNRLRSLSADTLLPGDEDGVTSLCLETLNNDHSVLIFCPTKNWCEKLANSVAKNLYQITSVGNTAVRFKLNKFALGDVVEQLGRSPAGLDDVLCRTVPYGVAFHHAGLTSEERDIVETGFRNNFIRILVATSTLSSGVNLPARRVIIRSPMFNRNLIDVRTYHQMSGRAGRKGIDEIGESILICKQHERTKVKKLLQAEMPPVKSCFFHNSSSNEISSSLRRAILEVIVNGIVSTYSDVVAYLDHSLLAAQIKLEKIKSRKSSQCSSGIRHEELESCIKWLEEHEFIFLHTKTDSTLESSVISATKLGKAALMSSLPTSEALRVLADLQAAAKAFALDSELHLVYQITPIYSANENINWFNYLSIFENLCPSHRRVSELVGVEERFLTRMATAGGLKIGGRISEARQRMLNIHTRFYSCMILHDLVQELSLSAVCEKYDCNRGMVQSLQQSASTFAGMVTAFTQQLGWWSLELLLREFQARLVFGVQRELLDLTQISLLNSIRARAFYSAGLTSADLVARASPNQVETILRNCNKFQSKHHEHEDCDVDMLKHNKVHGIYVPGSNIALTEEEAASAIIEEAKVIAGISDDLPGSQKLMLQQSEVSRNPNDASHYVVAGPDNYHHNSSTETPTLKVETDDLVENFLHEGSIPLIKDDVMNLKEISPNIEQESKTISLLNDKSNLKTKEREIDKKISNHVSEFQINNERGCINSSESNPANSVTSKKDFVDTELPIIESNAVKPCCSLTESQIAAFLDEFSEINNESYGAGVENDRQFERMSSGLNCGDPALPHSKSPTSSTPIPITTTKARADLSPVPVIANLCNPVALSKSDRTVEHSLGQSASSKDFITSQSNFSDDLFSAVSINEIRQNESKLHINNSTSVNWSSESAFICDVVRSHHDSNLDDSVSHDAAASTTPPFQRYAEDNGRESDVSFGDMFRENKLRTSVSISETVEDQLSLSVSGLEISEEKQEDLFVIDDDVAMKRFMREWKKQKKFSIAFSFQGTSSGEAASVDVTSCNSRLMLNGMAVYWEDRLNYIKFQSNASEDLMLNIVKEFFRSFDDSTDVIAYDVKCMFKHIYDYVNVDTSAASWKDPSVAVWLLDPDRESEDNCDDLTRLEKCVSEETLRKTDALLSHHTTDMKLTPLIDKDALIKTLKEAIISYHFMIELEDELRQKEMWSFFRQTEMPHELNLAILEMNGFAMDISKIAKYREDLQTKRNELEKQAWKVVGRKFNISNPVETRKILYNEMGVAAHKTKPRSTNRETLESLCREGNPHPLVAIIMDWRTADYALTNVIHPVLRRLNSSSSIQRYHPSTFKTVTGRTFMRMQWIPKRKTYSSKINGRAEFSDDGNEIHCLRDLFTVSDPTKYILVSADYSQIELRVMAHFSQDKSLLKSFSRHEDVFRCIAAEMVGRSTCPEQVTTEERQLAKEIIYSVLYGVGLRRLSHKLDESEEKAQKFKTHFLNSFPELNFYLKGITKTAEQQGFIVTLGGRRRYFRNRSNRSSFSAHSLRQAVHTTIQGSAADIMKIATCRINSEMKSRGWNLILQSCSRSNEDSPRNDCYLVHQIHDEIIYEVSSHLVKEAAVIIRDCMINAVKLRVPLTVKVKTGTSWANLSEYVFNK